MALSNYTLPFGGGVGASSLAIHNWATISPLQHHATAVNNLLYGPAGHQQQQQRDHQDFDDPSSQYYENYPYSPPIHNQQHQQQQQQQQHNQFRSRNNNYLPPSPTSIPTSHASPTVSSTKGFNLPQLQHQQTRNQYNSQTQTTRTYGENSFTNIPQQQNSQKTQLNVPSLPPQQQQQQYFNNGRRVTYTTGQQTASSPLPTTQIDTTFPVATPKPPTVTVSGGGGEGSRTQTTRTGGVSVTNIDNDLQQPLTYPNQATTFTRVQAGTGSRTQVHAVLDYDDDGIEEDEYYDDNEQNLNDRQKSTPSQPSVTPIQGPIFLKNGTVPVVPLFSYPTINNGSFVQIPIWWTALSVALGLEIRGEIIRGTPCVKRYNQLFCPTAGTSYPIERIEEFIDENKALMRRMYGNFQMTTMYGPPSVSNKKRKRNINNNDDDSLDDIPMPPGVPDFIGPPDLNGGKKASSANLTYAPPTPQFDGAESYFRNFQRNKRQSNFNQQSNTNFGSSSASQRPPSVTGSTRAPNNGPIPPNEPVTGRLDACESKIEIVTPYWASNSAGKIRAIVNTQHFEQAVHQEVCSKMQTSRCGGECGCEQKYKWHRLLAYDPDNDCRGIFMDWFLFPSCCVCRCNP